MRNRVDSDEFTDEDDFLPYYCPGCNRQVPRSISVRQGYCDECLARRAEARQVQQEQVATELAAEQRAVEEQRLEEQRIEGQRQIALYNTDTGHGVCPQCGSRNIRQYTTGGTDQGAQLGSCCVGCVFFLPLMFLSPFLFKHPSQLHAECNYCGHGWPL